MNENRTVTLNNGIEMPIIGLGVWKTPNDQEGQKAVEYALSIGYRHIDTAQFYANEEIVGKAIKESGVDRSEIFVTSKVELSNFGFDKTIESYNESLSKLRFEYLDLFILHFPVNKLRIDSYKALEQLSKDKRVKAIGVSNFTIEHLEELMENTDIVPTVNQVEFTPFLYQRDLLQFCREKRIQVVGYSPLTQGKRLDDPTLVQIASKYNKTTAQILIRWQIEHEIVVIPKSVKPERIKENFEVFDFEISEEDMLTLDSLNEDKRYSWDPGNKGFVNTISTRVIREISGVI